MSKDSVKQKWILTRMFLCWVSCATLIVSAMPRSLQAEQAGFWAPPEPLATQYSIDCQIDINGRQVSVEGTSHVVVRNGGCKPISKLALRWSITDSRTLVVKTGSHIVTPINASPDIDEQAPLLLLELPEPIAPGGETHLEMRFSDRSAAVVERDLAILTKWHPRVWWGFPVQDEFHVKVHCSDGVILTSGFREPGEQVCYGKAVREFGIVLSRDMQVLEGVSGPTQVFCLSSPSTEECANLLLKTAVDVIEFYRKQFGFYPHQQLVIIPGSEQSNGGYPVATGIVAVHGQSHMNLLEREFWQWIIAHEIGHQYWGEHVLQKDRLRWLMIALGLHADKAYMEARGLGLDQHERIISVYQRAVQDLLDTTISRYHDNMQEPKIDKNNIVVHGKGLVVINALESVLGKEHFDQAYRVSLDRYAGRRLGVAEFKSICEQVSGEDLSWFFRQWVDSNRYLCYTVTQQTCVREGDAYRSEAVVRNQGMLAMPVPVTFIFRDGTSTVVYTDRLLETNTVSCISDAPLDRVELDPSGMLGLIQQPTWSELAVLERAIRDLSWTCSDPTRALDLLDMAKDLGLKQPGLWFKLGLVLYHQERHGDALEAFQQANETSTTQENTVWRTAALVWKGHMLDLLGQRDEAVLRYEQALDSNVDIQIQHGHYGIVIDRDWVKARIHTPFQRALATTANSP